MYLEIIFQMNAFEDYAMLVFFIISSCLSCHVCFEWNRKFSKQQKPFFPLFSNTSDRIVPRKENVIFGLESPSAMPTQPQPSIPLTDEECCWQTGAAVV